MQSIANICHLKFRIGLIWLLEIQITCYVPCAVFERSWQNQDSSENIPVCNFRTSMFICYYLIIFA